MRGRRRAHRSDRPEQDFQEVISDADCRTDRRYLEIRASSYAARARLNWWSEATVRLRALTITTPCARAPRRDAEPQNLSIGVANWLSWAIGSSTSPAQRSFDVVVSRRSARPFASSAELGLQENGRPSPNGTALWPRPGSMDGGTSGCAGGPSPRSLLNTLDPAVTIRLEARLRKRRA
jgi:hypothetical protein